MKKFLTSIIVLFFAFSLFSQRKNSELMISGVSLNDWKLIQTDLEKPTQDMSYPIIYNFSLFVSIFGAGYFLYPEKDLHWEKIDSNHVFEALAFKSFRKDFDNWAFNYIAHPITGSESYLRFRMQGFSKANSFLFSLTASTLWETVIEGWVEPVSVQDIFITPIAGSILGEFRFQSKIWLKKQHSPIANVAIWLLDPLQTSIEGIYSLFSKKNQQNLPKISLYFFISTPKFKVVL